MAGTRRCVAALALSLVVVAPAALAAPDDGIVLAFDDPRGDAHGLHRVPGSDGLPLAALSDEHGDLVHTSVQMVRDPETGEHVRTDVTFRTVGEFDFRGNRISYSLRARLVSKRCDEMTVLLSAPGRNTGHDAKLILRCGDNNFVRTPLEYEVLADGRVGDAVVVVRVPASALATTGRGTVARGIDVYVQAAIVEVGRDDRSAPEAGTSFLLTD